MIKKVIVIAMMEVKMMVMCNDNGDDEEDKPDRWIASGFSLTKVF